MDGLTTFQRFALILVRTVIGWHFLYEGLYKLMLPAWTRDGARLAAWSAKGYLNVSTGPLAPMMQRLADSSLAPWIDILVPVGLTLVGLSLMLGLFTQLGCWGAIAFLAMFYASMPPTTGLQLVGAEGAYLFVNKNLVELAAVVVILSFKTGRIAGLDQLVRLRRRPESMAGVPVTVQE
jgi:thiosulfate dehydrogenase [quinone] large subunit